VGTLARPYTRQKQKPNQQSANPAPLAAREIDTAVANSTLARAAPLYLSSLDKKVLKGRMHRPGSKRMASVPRTYIRHRSAYSLRNLLPHPSGMSDTCVVLIPDARNAGASWYPSRNYRKLRARQSTGADSSGRHCRLGGAGFPTNIKLRRLLDRKSRHLDFSRAE